MIFRLILSLGKARSQTRMPTREPIKELRKVEVERDRGELDLARALDADGKEGETFSKLTRYEAAIERSPSASTSRSAGMSNLIRRKIAAYAIPNLSGVRTKIEAARFH
jgi:hypothetical protein